MSTAVPVNTAAAPLAVLFDMDGTLVDTERLWLRAVEEAAAELGVTVTDADRTAVLGRSIADGAAHLAARAGRAGDPATTAATTAAALGLRFAGLVRGGVVPLPGAVELLTFLAAAGVPTALVSASPRPVVDTVMDALGRHLFTTSVAEGETPRTKPHPDPYRAALTRLGLGPAGCVAVEDSPTGIASAEAAGCAVLAVPALALVPPGPRRRVVRALTEVDPALLGRLAHGS